MSTLVAPLNCPSAVLPSEARKLKTMEVPLTTPAIETVRAQGAVVEVIVPEIVVVLRPALGAWVTFKAKTYEPTETLFEVNVAW